jgi:hypothetical protein
MQLARSSKNQVRMNLIRSHGLLDYVNDMNVLKIKLDKIEENPEIAIDHRK